MTEERWERVRALCDEALECPADKRVALVTAGSAGDELGRIDIGVLVRLVRMDADGGPDVGLALSGGDDVVPLALAGRDVEHGGDTRGAGARQHGLLLLGDAFVVEVAVAIDQGHISFPSC